ncbi:tetratricopeptide repeat protein [Oscillochloris sp. ZM17-4]|uniref:tetratricopeptide repeat protein n=1 Tax=Oscillochloris sp. ZM17-4 TaxID=2866714 RepID=UPI001C72A6E6|nr:tetratricopeptide repeat protein [Oscillochloris sp. ZM17-4]MBX0327774.1 tetratricopeptide repeat protein [Oscillochloris sp. ZM17-4]
MANERFGRLVRGMVNAVAAFDGRQAVFVEEEIGALLGLAPTTIQGYKQGRVPEGWRPIEVLAEFGVRRAHLGRAWLQQLLDSVRYYDTQRLIDRLAPAPAAAPRPPRASDNLPAPTYSRFIMRPDAYQQVVEGLGQRSALLVIVGMGGVGKTSLALEVAKRCVGPGGPPAQGAPPPAFDAAVWVSGHDQPGPLALAHVLDAAALTLGFPGLTRLGLRERQHEVEQLLRQQRALIIADGFETSTDPALLGWLLRLPEPSKAIITTRLYRREFQRGAWLVELDGMGEAEADELIAQAARRLKLAAPAPEAARHLREVSGGNPKAIDLALGHARHTGQPLAKSLDALLLPQGELLDELFAQSWGLLTPGERAILVAAALFVGSAPPEALADVAGEACPSFGPALQKLADLSLIEIALAAPPEGGARYGLHPLTRSFVDARLPAYGDLDRAARERWLGWCLALAREAGGYAIDDLGRLDRLDPEEPTLFAAVGWAMGQGRHAEAIALIQALEFYYYVRALWGKKLDLHRWYIDAARALGDTGQEIAALALHIQLLSQQGRMGEAAQHLPRLHALAEAGPLGGEARFSYQHTLGVYHLADDDRSAARRCWEHLLATDAPMPGHMRAGAHHWLARCLAAGGDPQLARGHYAAALEIAREQGLGRLVARNQLGLAMLEIAAGELDDAELRLGECRQLTRQGDWEQGARLLWAEARLAARRGARAEAAAQYGQAHALLERMGLARESAEVGAEMAGLSLGL